MAFYNIDGNHISSQSINCKIIAHRGFHATAAQNTIAAIKAAQDAGFNWIEIDIRKTLDGIYILSHDATVTMYNSGVSTSVTFASSNYSTIKNYTWDSAGQYKLCTLMAVFNTLKLYDMHVICDKKTGDNADILALAALCGATDRVMISYSSYSAAYADRALLKKYDNVPIRVYPSTYADYLTLANEVTNPIFSDMNVAGTGAQTAIPTALSCGLPIIFAGCTLDNSNMWAVLANGCMANLDLNITYQQFVDKLEQNYDVVATITPSVASVSVASGSTSNLTAASNVSTPGGYVYGYILNPTVATLKQTAFGQNASFTVTGVSSGSTALRLFTGSGEIKDVPITVS